METNPYMDTILVISNLPDRESALRIAEVLISKRQAACVNVLAPCTSVYHWRDKLETAEEIPILIKTLSKHYEAVEKTILDLHPYELPEIVTVPIASGLPAYLEWIASETSLIISNK